MKWVVSRTQQRAITINASDVTLLFKGHYLKQLDHTVANTVAVAISAGVENVKISGGIITEVAGQAIVPEPGVKNIEVSDMTFTQTGYNGSLTTVIIPEFFVRQTSGVIAVNSGPEDDPVSNMTVSCCKFNDNGILDGVFPASTNFGAIFTNFAKNISVVDCDFDGLFGSDFSTAFIPINTDNSSMARCTIRNVIGNRETVGFAPTICKGGVYENIVVQNALLQLKADAPDAHGAEGAKLSECKDFVVRRCVAQNIKVESLEPTVQTESNTLVAQGFGTGSIGSPCKNVIFEDCRVQNVSNDGGLIADNGPFVRTAGFSIQGGTTNCHFINCSAENVESTIGRVMGFGTKRFKSAPNNSFVGCFANNIRGHSTGDGEYAAGFHLNSDKEVVQGCTAMNVTHEDGDGYGIVLDREQYAPEPLTEATQCLVQNNKVHYNQTAGIMDMTLTKNSVVSGTNAAFNGANYIGLNPVVYNSLSTQQDWAVSSAPAAVPSAGTVLANLDIHN